MKRTLTVALLGLILVMAVACSRASDTAPVISYLTEEVPPCTPVEGISVDPCEPDAPPYKLGVYEGFTPLGDEPSTVSFMHGDGQQPVWVTHLALRGTYFPGTVRCTTGDVSRPPSYMEHVLVNEAESLAIKCYIDVRANAYLFGSGPPTLTVLVFSYHYDDSLFTSLDEGQTEQDILGMLRQQFEGLAKDFLSGREHVIFLGPPLDLSSETWRLVGYLDVQRRDDSMVIAVHPKRDLWRDHRPDDYQTHVSTLEMELPALTRVLTEAHQARVTEYGGRIGADQSLPMLVNDANQLRQYYTDIGAYDHPDGPPVQPPPP